MSNKSHEMFMKVEMQLRLSKKQLERQAAAAGKQETAEKAKMEKEMKKGRPQIARIHAQNAVRQQNEQLNLLQFASRVDAVRSRIETAKNTALLTKNMSQVNKGLEVAAKALNLDRVTAIMDGFEKNTNDLDVVDEYTREATSSATAMGTPQDDVDRLMAETADKVGIELSQDLQEATPAQTKIGPTEVEEQGLSERLRALRN